MIDKNEMVNVIIPVYNVQNYLSACLEGILAQSYRNLEIILVNDGSQDLSSEICERYSARDDRVKYFVKSNGGLSDARNYGMLFATGNYISFIDSDDVVANNLIEHLMNVLTCNCADIAVCDPVHCYPQKKIEFTSSQNILIYMKEKAIEEMLYQKSFLVAAWAKIFRKSLFNDISFPKGKLFEDSAIMYKVFDNAKIIAYSDAKLYGYMHRENSITTKNFDERDFDIIDISEEIVEYFSNRSDGLKKAASSYQTTASLRVILNATSENCYDEIITKCKHIISSNYSTNIKDDRIRKKLKLGLILYKYFQPLMPFVYRKVNRWK